MYSVLYIVSMSVCRKVAENYNLCNVVYIRTYKYITLPGTYIDLIHWKFELYKVTLLSLIK